jgi:cytochrome c2
MTYKLLAACTIIMAVAGIAPGTAQAGAENKCKACHDFTTGKNKIGPSLKGVLGRPAGTYPGYHYVFKTYIKGKPWIWTEKRIREWDYNTAEAVKKLTGNPKAYTRMPSQFMTGKPEDQIINYIKKTSGKQVPSAGKASDGH